MNRFSIGTHAFILIVLAIGIIYSLPNLYPAKPAIQIAYTDSGQSADQGLLNEVSDILKAKNIQSESVGLKDNNIVAKYANDGFVAPLDIMTTQEALEIRLDFEDAEAQLANDPEKMALLRSYPNRLLPLVDKLTRNTKLIESASAVLGPDLMVWSAALFIKEGNSPKIVSWHQDLTYWGLDDIEETTCWFALSDASKEAGCMKFVPGTHKSKIVKHIDTFADNNLLSRGQEIAVVGSIYNRLYILYYII